MSTNKLINPTNARHALDSVGLVRIPFSKLNTTIKDMLSVYAADLVADKDYFDMCKQVVPVAIDVHTSYFYIFKASQYSTFLKLIAKEHVLNDGVLTCTSENIVLYSTQADASFDKCPTFTLADAESFGNIESTLYRRYFNKKDVHLCKITTRKQSLGCRPVRLTEVCLFIPE